MNEMRIAPGRWAKRGDKVLLIMSMVEPVRGVGRVFFFHVWTLNVMILGIVRVRGQRLASVAKAVQFELGGRGRERFHPVIAWMVGELEQDDLTRRAQAKWRHNERSGQRPGLRRHDDQTQISSSTVAPCAESGAHGRRGFWAGEGSRG
jgi:hypothetical protein